MSIWSDPSLTDWATALSGLVSAVAVVWALFYARRQVDAWRTEVKQRRRAELAEEILAAAHAANDLIASPRSPLYSIPAAEKDNRKYIYEQRYSQIFERGSIFETLRMVQIRAKFILQETQVDAIIDKIFAIRARLLVSLQTLWENADISNITDEEEKKCSKSVGEMYSEVPLRRTN